MHVDLVPEFRRDATVDSLLAIGATLVTDHRRDDGSGWAVLADPEGNEFCVERSAAERGHVPGGPVADSEFPPIKTAAEAEMLDGVLEWYREAVVRKVTGVSPADANTSPVRSGTTIAGVLKHLAFVEDIWFTQRFAGRPAPEPWASADWDADGDWEFHTAQHDTLEELVALYGAACARSRAAMDGHGLDDPAANSPLRPFNLRFAVVHLIEETARHLGHIDVLRELLDGTTGE